MNVKEHFAKSQAQHQALSDAHNDLGDACEKEGLESCAKAARVCAKVHGERAAHYKAMAGDAAEKAIADELNKGRAALEPTRVSGVTPTPPGITAVPRAGQKPLEKTVDPDFEHLVKIDAGNEE
jgi:hypothetical protein